MKDFGKIEVLNEDDQTYTISMEGDIMKFYKIDTKKLAEQHTKDLYEAARHVSKRNISEAMFLVGGLLKEIPTVDKYEESASNVSMLLRRFHFDLKPHNLTHLVHSLIKEIDIECYGKAQTFLHYLRVWYSDLKVIDGFAKEMVGKES